MTVRVALAFVALAALAAAWGSARWLPLHLFLAGGVVLAISGVSLMLTVTWSAAPAPSNRWVVLQRWCVAAGAAGIALGRDAQLPDPVIGVAGALYVTGLVVLAGLLLSTVRRGVERRFDVAVAAYVAAVVAGIGGAALGVAMAVTAPSSELRAAHVTLNLLGLVGLVVGATMPFFAATVGRARMSRHATPMRLAATLAWQVGMVVLTASALAVGAGSLAAFGLGGYAAGVVVVLAWLPRFTRRQLRWAGPRVLALWAGGIWWAGALVATAVDAAGGGPVFAAPWLEVLVVAGYAQILWGSLAYLLPMLRGGGHVHLSQGFSTTRSWLGLLSANIAGSALALSWAPVAAAAVTIWVLDSVWRAVRVGTTRAERPPGE